MTEFSLLDTASKIRKDDCPCLLGILRFYNSRKQVIAKMIQFLLTNKRSHNGFDVDVSTLHQKVNMDISNE